MLTVHRPLAHENQADTWIGPAPWIVTSPPGPMTQWAISRYSRVNLPTEDRPYHLVVRRAQGTIVEDVDGNRFLDFNTGAGVCVVGHCHPQVVQAIEAQAHSLVHIGGEYCSYEPAIELAEKLEKISPGRLDKRVLLTNSGTEAVEAAVRVIQNHTQRNIIVAFDGASHSRVLGELSMKANKRGRKNSKGFTLPVVKYVSFDNISAAKDLINRHIVSPEEVAAIFVEPVLCGSGYIIPPPEFLPQLRSLCDRRGILLVIDETRTGMGRTGKMFGCDHLGVVPDVLLLGDGLAGGMPIGAVVARKPILNWQSQIRGSNYGGNPVSCAAALATIKLLEKQFIAHAADLCSMALNKLEQISNRHNCLTSPRGMGLMLAVDIVKGRQARVPDSKLRDRIIREAFTRGLLLRECGKSGIGLTPPLCINHVQIEVGLDVFEEAVATVST